MGVTIREKVKGSGQWWVFLNHQDRRKSKLCGDKRTALAVASELRERVAKGDLGLLKKEVPTFGAYAKTWREKIMPATVKPSTRSDYEHILDFHVLPVFKEKPVSKIDRGDIKEFLLGKIQDGLAVSTVTHFKNVLSSVFTLALDKKAIAVNPAQRLGKILKPKEAKPAIDPLTRQELSLLLETIREHYPAHYPLALTLARTGMRIGEAMALQWGDLDFNGRFIRIERGFSRGKIETPKSGKSRRVDMSRQLAGVLQDLHTERKAQTLREGWGAVPEWVFVNEKGGPLDKDNWKNRVFNKALEKAKLRRVRVHDLRHTFASLLIQDRQPLAYVKEQLGHHSIKVTVDIYGHLEPGANREAVDRLDDAPIRTLSAPGRKKGLAKNR